MARPRLGVFKLASCDGCQLTLLDCEDELLAVADAVDIVHFPEASSRLAPDGPFDVVLVEGSVTTPDQLVELRHIRAQTRALVTIGACATAGGIQALRNFADVDDFLRAVYATPAYISTLATSTAIGDHVAVDYELRGCPINKAQLLDVIGAFLAGRRPRVSSASVCTECKRRGTVCVMVAHGAACLGPVTHAGCGALCPAYDRPCYGCFGPKELANAAALAAHAEGALGADRATMTRAFHTFNAWAEPFRSLSRHGEPPPEPGHD